MKTVTDWENGMRAQTPRPQEQVIELLNDLLEHVPALKNESQREDSGAFVEWQSSVDSVLGSVFGPDSPEQTRFDELRYESLSAVSIMGEDNTAKWVKDYQDGLDRAAGMIRSFIRTLDSLGLPAPKPMVQKAGNHFEFNPTFAPQNTNSQSQSQEQHIRLTFKEVKEQLSDALNDEQVKVLMPLIEDWEQKPTSWNKAQKVAGKALEFGQAAFVQVLPLLAQALLKSQGIDV